MTTATARRPRTQAERRESTRTALLEATIECLATHGYAGTTTVRVAEIAGLSRGAQLPYFPTRAELVAAAVTYLTAQRAQAVHERLAAGPGTLADALDALWDEHHGQGSTFDAALELWVAARSDAELRRHLHRAEHEVGATMAREAAAALPAWAARPSFADDLTFAIATIRGLALLLISLGDHTSATEQWQAARERLIRLIEQQ